MLSRNFIPPTPKSPKLTTFLELLTKVKRDGKQCVFCSSTIVTTSDFKDDLSRKEFAISMLCQKCQDDTFDG